MTAVSVCGCCSCECGKLDRICDEINLLRAVAEAAERYCEAPTTERDLRTMRETWGTLDDSQRANVQAVEATVAALAAWKEAKK